MNLWFVCVETKLMSDEGKKSGNCCVETVNCLNRGKQSQLVASFFETDLIQPPGEEDCKQNHAGSKEAATISNIGSTKLNPVCTNMR